MTAKTRQHRARGERIGALDAARQRPRVGGGIRARGRRRIAEIVGQHEAQRLLSPALSSRTARPLCRRESVAARRARSPPRTRALGTRARRTRAARNRGRRRAANATTTRLCGARNRRSQARAGRRRAPERTPRATSTTSSASRRRSTARAKRSPATKAARPPSLGAASAALSAVAKFAGDLREMAERAARFKARPATLPPTSRARWKRPSTIRPNSKRSTPGSSGWNV